MDYITIDKGMNSWLEIDGRKVRPDQLAYTLSHQKLGGIVKEGKGWFGVASGDYIEQSVSEILPTRKAAHEWLMHELTRQLEARTQEDGLNKYRFFEVANGTRASKLVEILKVFEAHKAGIGHYSEPEDGDPAEAYMTSPLWEAERIIGDAITPSADKMGLRDRTYLCDNEAAVLAAMAAFPREITLCEPVYLPLRSAGVRHRQGYTIEMAEKAARTAIAEQAQAYADAGKLDIAKSMGWKP